MDEQARQDREAAALKLFMASLEQPEDGRERWLQQAAKDDSALLEAAQALLKADQLADGYLEAGPVTLVTDRTGERVGRFELQAQIGQGGMGTVYRGRRADGTFEQSVAVKLFSLGQLNESALQRFHTERQILASLEHPGIARLIDGGTAEDGTPFVVMELVEGLPINEFCDREGLDLPARLELFRRVCDALAEAHLRGIVHRDLKPSNILITPEGRPKLIDFGIAKVLDSADFDSSSPDTRLGTMALTPEYASPEQVRGEAQSQASDTYALGILLYELVTGVRPYRISSPSPVEIERTVCDTIPPDPSVVVGQRKSQPPNGLQDASRLKSSLRGDLDRIVMTALRKSPQRRYASAAALAEDIDRYLNGLPVHARGASRWYRAGKFIQRHKAIVSVTSVAFAALSVALVLVFMQAQEAERQRDLARQQADAAASATEFLTEMISRSDPFANAESATLLGAMMQAIPTIEERFENQPELEADMRYAIGYALQNLGETDTSRAQFDRALDLRRQYGTALDVAEALGGLALVDWW
ncbi:MAG: protein kinase, partial [Pseudomonadota bacterium]